MTRNEIMSMAFKDMPSKFHGNEFGKKCRELGMDEKAFRQGICSNFLHKHAFKEGGARTWVKAKIKEDKVKCLSEERCIEFLKQTGKYRIYLITQKEI